MVDRYAAGEGEGEGGQPRAFVSLNWLLTEEPLDLETELVGGCACVCVEGLFNVSHQVPATASTPAEPPAPRQPDPLNPK